MKVALAEEATTIKNDAIRAVTRLGLCQTSLSEAWSKAFPDTVVWGWLHLHLVHASRSEGSPR
ncbi:MAG: hypothetical protein OXI74_18555 [Rhodospirillaceae bacterium]|nr:hypothetical protein [Rhodospirillaceae bacterium]